MRLAIFYFLLLLTLVGASGCRKEVIIVDETGDLVVNARDGAGTSLIGSTVYLYDDLSDFNNSIYAQTRITNNSGQVRFDNLYPGVYYVDCDFENNYNQIIVIFGSGSVSAGYETTVTIRP
jgi:hypothetical protein